MKAFLELVGAIGMLLVTLFLLFTFSPIVGALTGFVVGLLFEPSIRDVFMAFGVDLTGVAIWQLGAVLAFVGMFFKTALPSKKADKS